MTISLLCTGGARLTIDQRDRHVGRRVERDFLVDTLRQLYAIYPRAAHRLARRLIERQVRPPSRRAVPGLCPDGRHAGRTPADALAGRIASVAHKLDLAFRSTAESHDEAGQ